MVIKKDDVQEKTYTKIEHDGVIKDLQNERTNRQQAQFELEQNRRELESLKKTVAELKNSKPEKLASDEIEFEGEDSDPATVKEVKRGLKSLEKTATATFKTAQKAAKAAAAQELAQEKYDESCRSAEIKYAKLADIGLDFRTVQQAAFKRIGSNPYEQAAIFHSKDPGERLYEEGSKDPGIKAKLDLEENQELLRNMERRPIDKTSLTGGVKVKSNEFFTPQEVINMTPLEAKDNLPKLEKSIKHWEELKNKK